MSISTGLVSVTFRQFEPADIVNLVKDAGLDGIEWGGDIHVPHGDIKRAKAVGDQTRDAGLEVLSYGSYYDFDESCVPFSTVLQTALALDTKHIRIWAGNKGSDVADEKYRAFIVQESRRIVGEASKAGVSISFEFHSGSLTDTTQSAINLTKQISRKKVTLYWQPTVGVSTQENVESLVQVLPYLTNIHAFYWHPTISDRRLLGDGISDWMQYLPIIQQSHKKHSILLEFVLNDSPEAFLEDAETLKRLLK